MGRQTQTRQFLGGILRHWKITNTSDHYIAVDVFTGGAGFTGGGYSAGVHFIWGQIPRLTITKSVSNMTARRIY